MLVNYTDLCKGNKTSRIDKKKNDIKDLQKQKTSTWWKHMKEKRMKSTWFITLGKQLIYNAFKTVWQTDKPVDK